MANWTVKARDIRPGDVWRWLGPGYMSREVLSVAHLCNCQNWAGRMVEGDGTPKHVPVVVVTTASLTGTQVPWAEMTLTDDRY